MGCEATASDEPAPTGAEPTRSSVRQPLHLRREEVLARLLVAAAADDPDLVAVVDNRCAAEQVEQRCGRAGRARSQRRLAARALRSRRADAAHVVVAEEGRRRVRDAVRRPGSSRRRRAERDAARSALAGGIPDEPVLEREVEDAGSSAVPDERDSSSASVMNTSPKSEVGHAGRARGGQDLRQPQPEERVVDVPRRVDPETVDLVTLDPGRRRRRQPVGQRPAAP